MSDSERRITRRDFMRGVGLGALAAAAGLEASAQGEGARKARVVLIRDESAVDSESRVNAEVVQRMLDQGVAKLLGANEAAAAWKELVKPTDRVGIKTNVWRPLRTPPEVEQAIKKGMMSAGVSAGKIAIDDRGARRTLANCTALINVRPLRTHHWAGIGGCLKNMIMFVPRPVEYHHDSCADLGAMWKLPGIKGKVKLNVLVVLTPQFHGRGPHNFDPRYVWPYKGLLLSQDPVAVDAVGVKLLQVKRRLYFGEERGPSTSTSPTRNTGSAWPT